MRGLNMYINHQKPKETKDWKKLNVESGAEPLKRSKKGRITLETLKLATALELWLDGYDNIAFNKMIGRGNKRVCIHVYAEDTMGSKVAICCVGRSEQAKRDNLADVVYMITESIGEDCQIAITIPINLMDMVDEIADVVYRIYMIDSAGRVWIHDTSRHFSFNRIRNLPRFLQKPEMGNWRPADARNSTLHKNVQYVI